MEYLSLRGTKVPALGLGTWQLEGDDCRAAVPIALDLGYRHIDTAQLYGNESEIGEALAAAAVDRDALFVTTKVLNDYRGSDEVVRSAEDSLRRLQLDHVDLLLIHWPVEFERIAETLDGMTRALERGLTRAIGVSNFTVGQFRKAAELAPIACNQVEYHPFLDQTLLREAVVDADALLTTYSPLARGGVFDDETLRSIGQAYGKSPAQVALRWLLDQQVLVVPKATSRQHLLANLDVFDFELTPADRQQVDGLARGQRLIKPAFAPKWED